MRYHLYETLGKCIMTKSRLSDWLGMVGDQVREGKRIINPHEEILRDDRYVYHFNHSHSFTGVYMLKTYHIHFGYEQLYIYLLYMIYISCYIPNIYKL